MATSQAQLLVCLLPGALQGSVELTIAACDAVCWRGAVLQRGSSISCLFRLWFKWWIAVWCCFIKAESQLPFTHSNAFSTAVFFFVFFSVDLPHPPYSGIKGNCVKCCAFITIDLLCFPTSRLNTWMFDLSGNFLSNLLIWKMSRKDRSAWSNRLNNLLFTYLF